MSQEEPATSRDRLFHRLTIVTLGATILVLVCFVALFFAPSLSPFGEKDKPTRVALLPTTTPRPTTQPTDTPVSTWTPEPTSSPAPTLPVSDTPMPSHFPDPTPTFPPTWTPVLPTGTPPPTRSNYPFALQNNEIIYTQYFFSSGCDWLGIAGLVMDKEGDPIVGLPVVLNGGGFQNHATYSGHAPAYGESGWEHFLDNKVKEGDFSIQLYSNEPQPISDLIHVHTRADCRGNLIMIVFELNWDEYVPK
jgi:hypothetical protein